MSCEPVADDNSSIVKHFSSQMPAIEQWFHRQWQRITPPFYASVDLRFSNFKLAPIDTNLFPAGFNNLNENARKCGSQMLRIGVERVCPQARKVLLIPESHTRNQFYFESLATLFVMLQQAGLDARISTLRDIEAAETIVTSSGIQLTFEPLQRRNNTLVLEDGFTPCVVILNNDLSAGVPAILHNAAQPLLPPLQMGWRTRRKSVHFAHYDTITDDFADEFDIDPWHIRPLNRQCGTINFKSREGEDCLAENVAFLLETIQKKYTAHNITCRPFVIVKADAGTYGMSIMSVRSAHEIYELNRKQRNKMASGKEGNPVANVIIQEGIYTFETIQDNAVAEPVMYMVDRDVIGGFYRAHHEKSIDQNLNAPGMHFSPIPIEPGAVYDNKQARFYAFSVIARLAQLASALERDADSNNVPSTTQSVAV